MVRNIKISCLIALANLLLAVSQANSMSFFKRFTTPTVANSTEVRTETNIVYLEQELLKAVADQEQKYSYLDRIKSSVASLFVGCAASYATAFTLCTLCDDLNVVPNVVVEAISKSDQRLLSICAACGILVALKTYKSCLHWFDRSSSLPEEHKKINYRRYVYIGSAIMAVTIAAWLYKHTGPTESYLDRAAFFEQNSMSIQNVLENTTSGVDNLRKIVENNLARTAGL